MAWVGSSFYHAFQVLLFHFLLQPQPFNSQQDYINFKQLLCHENSSIAYGYECNGPQLSCLSYVTFRSRAPHNSPDSIACLLSSTASEIASINGVRTPNHIFPTDKLVIVPIPCTCWGTVYEHYIASPYIVKANESWTYFQIANQTYQGLTSCQRLSVHNTCVNRFHQQELRLLIPIRCACPSSKQMANGVTHLVVYLITWDDTIQSISEVFGVSPRSILEANKLSQHIILYPFTPLLVPLKSESCKKKPESFFCKQGGKGFPIKLVAILGVGIGVGLLSVFVIGYQVFLLLKRRRNRIKKEKLFKQNGGFLLQERFKTCPGSSEKAKLFTSEELQSATDNYNQNRVLGRGGYGTVYKGMLSSGTIVAIKRPRAIDQHQIEQFINEVFILSQINHRNIVKLLGCCLETEIPLLVYEFIPKGTLSQHIHDRVSECCLSWERRVRIVCEIAGAVAYMHSAASNPIFHRDIKSSNVLLDENYSAKVSDFGTSRTVPIDKTHLTTGVQGTFGYLDPQYFRSGKYTEKSDVYSFGVVLVEVLTGEKPVSFARPEEKVDLVAYFLKSVKEDILGEILDAQVGEEARGKDVDAIANVAVRCLNSNGKKRPTMKEVAMELEGIRNSSTTTSSSNRLEEKVELWGDEVSYVDSSGEDPSMIMGEKSPCTSDSNSDSSLILTFT